MAAKISDYFIESGAATESGFRTKKKNIPFYVDDKVRSTIKVKLVYDIWPEEEDKSNRIRTQAFKAKLPQISKLAANRFILHYYPELYIYYRTRARGKEAVYPEGQDEIYSRVRQAIKSHLTSMYYKPGDHTKDDKRVVITTLNALSYPLTRPDVQILKQRITSAPSEFTGLSAREPNTNVSMYQKISSLRVPEEGQTITFDTTSPFALRQVLELLGYLPDMSTSLGLFNDDEGITPTSQTTTLSIGSMVQSNNLVNDGLSSFQQQINGFEGSLPINLNFDASQRGMMQILNAVVYDAVVQELFDGPPQYSVASAAMGSAQFVEFADADSFSITFGTKDDKTAISQMSYLVNSVSLQQQILKTGYMTNMLWNSQLQDPLTLATLKNYNKLVDLMASMAAGGPPASFMDFLDPEQDGSVRADFNMPEEFTWDDIPSPVETQNLFLKEAARMGVIDLGDVENLEKGWYAKLSKEKRQEYKRAIRENPAVYKKVMMATKKKSIATAANVAKVIAEMMEGNIPPLKANSPLGQLLRQIGIQELVREVLRCMTLGTAPAFASLTRTVESTIKSAGRELYSPPPTPGEGGAPPGSGITMPEIKISDYFKIPTLDGELWPGLKKALLDGLMAGVLEIVKSMAKLLEELCTWRNPRGQDFGANDLANMVNDNLNNLGNEALGSPSAFPSISNPGGSPLDQTFGKYGLTFNDAMNYLRDLSAILSSIEICFLFTNLAEVSYETLEKILEFNLGYSDINVRNNLNTFSAITGFFSDLSRFVDLTDFCNEIANELYQANIDNVCLIEDAAPSLLRDLLEDMAENGLGLDNPLADLNLECPDRENYIENPLMTEEIPRLMNTIVNVIKIEFNNSLTAAQQTLKESRIRDDAATDEMARTLAAAGIVQTESGISAVGQDIMSTTQEIFGNLEEVLERLGDSCDLEALLGIPADQIATVMQIIIHIISQLFSKPEFIDAMGDLESAIDAAAHRGDDPAAGPPAMGYEFPERFTQKFESYLTGSPTFNPVESFDSIEMDIVSSNNFYSRTPSLASPGGSSHYRAPTLYFNFPTTVTGSWIPDPDGRNIGTTNIPMFIYDIPSTKVDRLQIKYPSNSSVETNGRYIDIQLNSALVPDSAEALSFSVDTPPSSYNESSRDTNPYASLFTDNLIGKIILDGHNVASPTWSDLHKKVEREVDTVLFPSAYAGLVEASFNYIQANGIFTTEKLDSLNFFHDNTRCLPEEIADLLDLGSPGPPPSGILGDINEEMINAMCYDPNPADSTNPKGLKIRDVIRYALFLLLIQIHIAQFIIKNIFVFAAFEIDDIMASPLVEQFMATSIRDQVIKFVQGRPVVVEYMVGYFNKKLKRAPVQAAGGLLDMDGEVVTLDYRGTGAPLEHRDFPAIVEYMVRERIFKSKRPVANAVRRSSNKVEPKKFTRAFVDNILTVQPSFFGGRIAGNTTPSAPQRKIYVTHNDNTLGAYGPLTGTSVRPLLDSVAAKIETDEQGAATLEYGRLVLERQVVWDNVVAPTGQTVPTILRRTTGADYGLELDLFMQILFNNSHTIADVSTTPDLTFENLQMRYNIVYYLPIQGADDDVTNGLFYDTLPLHKTISLAINENITLNRIVLARLGASLTLGNSASTAEVISHRSLVPGEIPLRYEIREIPILQKQLEAYGETVFNSELLLIAADSVFSDYFGKTFSREMTVLIPVLYNFYLTSGYFPKMDTLFMGAKGRCIQTFIDTVLNQEDVIAEMVATGPPLPTAPPTPGDLLQERQNLSALDFINKMLIETPISILRGVCEMLDPHVGISKIIKDLSRFVFMILAQGIDTGLKAPPARAIKGFKSEDQGGPTDAELGPIPRSGLNPGLQGSDVMNLLFCALDVAMQGASQGNILWDVNNGPPPPSGGWPQPIALDSKAFTTILGPLAPPPPGNFFVDENGATVMQNTGELLYKLGQSDPRDPRNNVPDAIKDNLFPRITLEGVDFTGTFLGILMMPPGPFGLVYLLFMLLKSALDEQFLGAPGDEDGAPMSNLSEGVPLSDCEPPTEEEARAARIAAGSEEPSTEELEAAAEAEEE